MKFALIAFASSIALSHFVAAQVSSCAAQQILDTCLDREKNYFKYCSPPESDYACLCKVNTALLTCYDNCPQDIGKANIQGYKDTYCSIAKTYNTTTSSVVAMSSVAATNIPSNSVIAPLPSSSITATKNSTSAAMSVDRQGGVAVTLFVAGITSWYLA
ncbi:unnamed protein product [Mucor hiemalis]